MNNYNKLSDDYNKTHEKPDKKYSMVPTLIKALSPLGECIVIDVGCGDGFFSKEIAKEAKQVIGIDNSQEQIKKAKNSKLKNSEFLLSDMFEFEYPKSDRISVPFVINYVKSLEDIKKLFNKFYNSLNEGGIIAGIMDYPRDLLYDYKRFGAVKKIIGDKIVEGVSMNIELFNGEKHLVTLHSFFHEKKNIEKISKEIGFSRIEWITPVISKEGFKILGAKFWKGYIENCDLIYFKIKK